MGCSRSEALEAWLTTSESDEATVLEATKAQLEDLLALPLALPQPSEPSLVPSLEQLARQLTHLDPARLALMEHLAPDTEAPAGSFVLAVAEILFVPRTERTEYRTHRLASPPWDIRRLLIEYGIGSLRVDRVATGLTRSFCASRCSRLPEGCCTVLGYDLGIVPATMLRAQELEARIDGWSPPEQERECRYHGRRGCQLSRFKSPACTGMLCDALVAHLRSRFAAPVLEPFLQALGRFRVQVLDRDAIFDAMHRICETAAPLAAAQRVELAVPSR